jgi:LacI family transcriptional regulator
MEKRKAAATLRDVAQKAGVSVSTVSRALKDSESISTATRARIKRIAERLGYLPNQAAQMLIARKRAAHRDTALFSIIYESGAVLNDYYFSSLTKSLVDESSRDGFATAIYALVNTYDGVLDLSRLLHNRFTAGIVLLGNIEDRLLPMLARSCPNIVIVDKPSALVSSVTNDNERGAYEAVSFLLASGARRVALIHGTAGHYFTLPMQAGYRRALRDAGVPYDRSLCVEGEFHVASGRAAMRALLRGPRRPDAVFSNDEMAVGAMRAIKEAGLSIPSDIAVFGFDNNVLSEIVEPRLSTVKVEYEYMARTAVRTLVQNVHKEKPVPVTITIPVELVLRESTPAARGAGAERAVSP